MKNYTSALALIMSISGAYASDKTVTLADQSDSREKKAAESANPTYQEKHERIVAEMVKKQVGGSETSLRDTIVKEEQKNWEAIQMKLKTSFETAQQAEKERYQNLMMMMQNQFVEKLNVALLSNLGSFIKIHSTRHNIDRLKFKETFNISADHPIDSYERSEDIYEKDGKLYAAYKKAY